MFAHNRKQALLLECLFNMWAPHRRCARSQDLIALTKDGWIIEFHKYEARWFQPGVKRPKLAFRAAYKNINPDPRSPAWLGPLTAEGHMFSLKEPWKGFIQVDMPPDFVFLKQFVRSIQELSLKTGKAPPTLHLVNHIYHMTKKELGKKLITKALLQGEGYFWTTKMEKCERGPGRRRLHFIIPGRTIRDAEQIYKDTQAKRRA